VLLLETWQQVADLANGVYLHSLHDTNKVDERIYIVQFADAD
jgi:hypothetical protein